MRADVGVEALGHEADAGTGMLEDVAELGPVQLRIDRHRGKAGEPDAVQDLEILGRVLRDNRDPVARCQADRVAQGAGEEEKPLLKLATKSA